MKKFVIIANLSKDPKLEFAKKIEDYIRKQKAEVYNLSMTADGPVEFDAVDYASIPKDTECILVLGGDGTLIRVVRQVRSLGIPLIGINLGTLGYLCELEKDTVFDGIDRLLADEYTVEERLMLKGQRAEGGCGRTALNDIVIHRPGVLALMRLNVYVNGEFLATYEGDGVILSTPTGSTGYNLSAGGPIIEPGAQILALTPINAHSLSARGIILKAEDVIEVEMASRRDVEEEAAYVSCDGDRITKLLVGERFVIQAANHRIRICQVNKESFLEIMSKKMR